MSIVSSCQIEQVNEYIECNEYAFEAKNEDSSHTKTLRDEDGTVMWTVNDEIKVFCDETPGRFVSQNDEPSSNAIFKGSFDSYISIDDILKNGVIAFYPYSDNVIYDSGSIIATIPNHQTGVKGTFSKDLFPCIAKSSDTDLYFINICGGVKFTVSRKDIRTVTLRGNNGEYLSGKIKVSLNIDNDPKIEIINGETEVMFSAPNGGVFEIGKEYYIVTLPQELKSGFSLIYNDNADYSGNVFTTSKPVVIKRSTFGVINGLDSELEMKNMGEAIKFKDPLLKEMCLKASYSNGYGQSESPFDANNDGEISYSEAADVRDIDDLDFSKNPVSSFDEFQYFTSVGHIKHSKFKDCVSLESISLPNVYNLLINSYAFSGCVNLKKIDMPDHLSEIRDCAFYGCSNLKSIVIPEGAGYIAESAFEKCSALESISIADDVDNIQPDAFKDCYNLRELNFNGAVSYIGDAAFYGCSNLKKITMPNAAMNQWIIGESTFEGCSSLEVIDFFESDTSMEYIKERAFYGCSSLREISLPPNILEIGSSSFYGCESLESLILPDKITSLGLYTFRGCYSLKEINIPTGVANIGSQDFYGCSSLEKIDLPRELKAIGSEAFANCISLKEVTLGRYTNSIDAGAFMNCESLVKISLPSSITKISNETFRGCSSLQNISIPNSVSEIGRSAFAECSALTTLKVPEGLEYFAAGFCYNCSNLESINVPASVVAIYGSAFEGCAKLKQIDLHSDVKEIGKRAFADCISLENMTTRVGTIGDEAFKGCTSLKYFEGSGHSIGKSSFEDCTGLSEVLLLSSNTNGLNEMKINDFAFRYCSSLTSVTLRALVPPALGISVFSGNAAGRKFYVRSNVASTYRSADGWKTYSSDIVGVKFDN